MSDTDHLLPAADPLTGFGDTPIPRVGRWSPDVLGTGFQARLMQLLPDEEGEVVATLVRHVAQDDPHLLAGTPSRPRFRALYIHGWNDYFFHREMARQIALAGGEFFALDLRKYGRSWRANQTFGWVTDLKTYDEDIEEALAIMGTDLPLVLMAHSTGGLTAALWAHRHRDQLAGLWLNSPWLELQTSSLMRYPTQQVVELIGGREPRRVLPTGGNDFYSTSLSGWRQEEGPLPEEWQEFATDPSLAGWEINPVWKNTGRVTLAGWLAAVTAGHLQVAEGLNITAPVFTAASTKTFTGKVWDDTVRASDTVLDADVVAERAARLGSRVWVERLPGVHDLALSIPPVRRQLWSATLRWLATCVDFPAGMELAREDARRLPSPEDVQLAPR
ncbi:MAG: alpha/beta hydrolase [Actinomycetaceae bacterium]|nr:alpha/beta hydrolase [Actinomycetaceae bacterium]